MKPTDRYPNTSVISVYQSLWKNMLLVAVGLAWGVGGYFIFTDPSTDWPTKVAGGLLPLIFFQTGALIIAIVTLFQYICRTPYLIIHEDRLEIYDLRKRTYHIVYFADIKGFRLIKINSIKYIAIDYKNLPLIHKLDESSASRQKMMKLNFDITGAAENIAVHNLTIKGKALCDILNQRREAYSDKDIIPEK